MELTFGQARCAMLSLERVFAAPVERVYEAWTQPESLSAWVWGSLGEQVESSVDLRVGGLYSSYTRREGRQEGWTSQAGGEAAAGCYGMAGLYVEIVPNRRLVYTLHWDSPMGYNQMDQLIVDEVVIVDFEPEGEGTRMRFQQLGIPDDGVSAPTHATGIEETFDYLERLLAG